MGTAGTVRTWARPMAVAELRPPVWCHCDLCRDDEEAMLIAPANDNSVQRQREAIAEAEARRFACELSVY